MLFRLPSGFPLGTIPEFRFPSTTMPSDNLVPLVDDLLAAGMTLAGIAKSIGVAQSTVAEPYAAGKWDPRHSTGQAVEALHRKVMAQKKRKESRATA